MKDERKAIIFLGIIAAVLIIAVGALALKVLATGTAF